MSKISFIADPRPLKLTIHEIDQNAMLLDDHNCIKYFNVEELGIKYIAIKELDNYRGKTFKRKEIRLSSEVAKDS